MAAVQLNAIYIVSFWRPYPPGDPFHWGLLVRTSAGQPTLFHAVQKPGWVYEKRENYNFESSQVAVQAAKIGSVPSGTTPAVLDAHFRGVPVGNSASYAGEEWRCNHWTRDVVRLLVGLGWVQTADVDKMWEGIKEEALKLRDKVGSGEASCQLIDVTK